MAHGENNNLLKVVSATQSLMNGDLQVSQVYSVFSKICITFILVHFVYNPIISVSFVSLLTENCSELDFGELKNCSVSMFFLFSIFIQEHGLSVGEQVLLSSCSEFVMLALKTLRSHSNISCLCLDFLHGTSAIGFLSCSQICFLYTLIFLLTMSVKIHQPIESQV